MTAHLSNACREIDDLLLECLLTWTDETGRQREMAYMTPFHVHFVHRSNRLIEARSAIEAAMRALEMASADGAVAEERHSSAGLRSRPDHAADPCHRTSRKHHGSGQSTRGDHSSSRPDRPQRPQATCRGQVRDWNRDILACRHDLPAWPGAAECGCSHDGAARTGSEQAVLGDAEAPGGTTFPQDEPLERELDPHQRDEAFVKEPENGAQGKSTRSRKRG